MQNAVTEIEESIARIERQCASVALVIAGGDPTTLEAASNELRNIALDFSRLMEQRSGALMDSPVLRDRLRRAAQDLQNQRGALMRWMALAERSVEILVPTARKATYHMPHGRSGGYRSF